MEKNAKEKMKELEKFKTRFPGKQINAVYDIVENTVNHDSDKDAVLNKMIKEVAVKYEKSTDTVRYWLKKYNTDGIIPLLDMTTVATKMIKRDGRPVSEWNKRTLCTYLNEHKPQDEKAFMQFSETFCFNILKKLNKIENSEMNKEINLLYQKQKDVYQFIFIDYMILPPSKNPFSLDVKYIFIALQGKELYIKKVTVNRNRMRWDSPVVSGFAEALSYIKDNKKLLMEDSYCKSSN